MLRNSLPVLRNINVLLTDYFPDRSCNAIRSLRKLAIYKTKYKLISDSIGSDSLHSSSFQDSINMPELLPFHLISSTPGSSGLPIIPPSTSVGLDSSFTETDIINEAINSDTSEFKFNCDYCNRAFNTKIGLSQHKRHKHFDDYSREVQQAASNSRNTLWDDEEVYLLARFEKDILESKEVPVRNMNQLLHARFTHRTINQISCMRKRDKYK